MMTIMTTTLMTKLNKPPPKIKKSLTAYLSHFFFDRRLITSFEFKLELVFDGSVADFNCFRLWQTNPYNFVIVGLLIRALGSFSKNEFDTMNVSAFSCSDLVLT